MPRIDPEKLLNCIGILLSPNGGIRSTLEVKRLSGLMEKYCKKLVSKCIYIQILKCTDTELLGQFMETGGWKLAHSWLKEGIESKNWALLQELLELLLLCPVDVPRLQSNDAPRLVKGLSREGSGNDGVRILASKLVEQWLTIAKGETAPITSQNSIVNNKENIQIAHSPIILNKGRSCDSNKESDDNSDDLHVQSNDLVDENDLSSDKNVINETNHCNEGLVFKLTVKDGKQILAKVTNDSSPKKRQDSVDGIKSKDDKESTDDRTKSKEDRHKSKDRNHDKSKKSSSSSSSHKSSSSKLSSSSSSKHSGSSSKHKSSSTGSHRSGSSSSSSREKSKNSSSSSSKSKSSSSRDKHREKDKEKEKEKLSQADKDKDTLAKILPQSTLKLAKIPKKTSSSSSAGDDKNDKSEKPSSDSSTTSNIVNAKKKSISIEVRKGTDRPKTVKTYNAQFRSHGLAEEAPPPPSRKDLKKPSPTTTPGTSIPSNPIAVKRSLSPTGATKEVEKKIKLATSPTHSTPTVEKPGAIKLIPAKPKPSVLVESDMFMDAMMHSASTAKKDVKKRKRLSSSSKESEVGAKDTKETKDSKEGIKSSVPAAPMKFYQDTLDDNNKDAKANDGDSMDVENEDDGTEAKRIKTEDAESDEKDENSEETQAESNDDEAEKVKREPGIGCGPDGPPGVLLIHRRRGPKKSLRWRPQECLEEVRYFELDENERVNVTKTFVDMKQMERVSEREAFLIARKGVTEDNMVEQMSWRPLIEVDDVPEPAKITSKEKEIQAEREKTCLKTIYFDRSMIPDCPMEVDIITFQNVEPVIIPLINTNEGEDSTVLDFTNMPWPEPRASPPHIAEGLNDINGLMNLNPFGTTLPAANWSLGIPPTGIPNLPPNLQLADLNALANPAIAANFVAGNAVSGFVNNFRGIAPPINDNRGINRNNGPNGKWFPGNVNGGNNWQQQGNNGNHRSNWVQNRRICKQFQRGYCRHGDSCKFLHPGINGPAF